MVARWVMVRFARVPSVELELDVTWCLEPHFDTGGESDRFGKSCSPLPIYVDSYRAFNSKPNRKHPIRLPLP